MTKKFHTERLSLIPLNVDDATFIFHLVNTKGWIQFIGDRNVKDTKSAIEYIQRILSNNRFFYNVFEIKETNTPIGIVTFLYRENYDSPDIGFAMLPQYAKKGFAHEATKNYLEKLRENNIGKIIAITKPENENSSSLLIKLGLQFEKNFLENDEELDMYSISINTY